MFFAETFNYCRLLDAPASSIGTRFCQLSRDALCDILESEGYSVTATPNGEDALGVLRSSGPPPDVIILDMLMPGINGFGFRRVQKKDPTIASIPVVAATAMGRVSGIDADVILHKPLDIDVLLRVVDHFCLGHALPSIRN